MQIHNVVQGSEEWLELRKGVATASEFDNIITPARGDESDSIPKYAKKLALELYYEQTSEKEAFKSLAMQAGNEFEPLARQRYQEKTWNIVEECGFITSDCGNFGYSPDGLVGDDGIIEIKNLEAEAHSNILLNPVFPNKYKCQVQAGLWISERKWLDFIAFNRFCKDINKQLIVIRVERDEDFINKMFGYGAKLVKLRDEMLSKLQG